MDKRTYLLTALAAGAYRWKKWTISIFAVMKHPESLPNPEFAYQLQQVGNKLGFLDPDTMQVVAISDSSINESLFKALDGIDLKKGQIPNLDKDVRSSIGNLIFNCQVLVYPFGNKIPFITGKVKLKAIEKQIIAKLEDDVPEEERVPDKIYVSELIKYIDAATALSGYSQLFVPSATPYTMTASKDALALRDKLIAENKDKLHDPSVVADIGAQIEAVDRAYIAQDPDAGFYQKDKSFSVVRKKLHYMQGLEIDFTDKATFMGNSLAEGWDLENLPAMANVLRDGSFSRGALTALGGEKTKTIFRVMSGAVIAEPDCGTKVGLPFKVTADNIKDFVGSTVIVDGKQHILEDVDSGLVGKDIMVRSPMTCRTSQNNYCLACMGQFIRGKENTLGAVAAEVGSTLMSRFMAAMHGKALRTVKYDWNNALT
jgi:hypothetical protein